MRQIVLRRPDRTHMRVAVVRRRRRPSAAIAMRDAGFPAHAIRAALGMDGKALESALRQRGFWGAYGGLLRELMGEKR